MCVKNIRKQSASSAWNLTFCQYNAKTPLFSAEYNENTRRIISVCGIKMHQFIRLTHNKKLMFPAYAEIVNGNDRHPDFYQGKAGYHG